MKNNTKITVNKALHATIVVTIGIAIITVLAEISPLIKNALATVFTHHWVGKSILVAIIWFLLARYSNDRPLSHPVTALHHALLWSTIAITAYYVLHHIG